MCCRGLASPFASWPVRAVMLGFPGSGTTSMSWLLSSHPNISRVQRDPRGRPWAGHEMQTMNLLGQKALHEDVAQFGRWIGRDLRFAKNLYMMRRGKFLVMLREPARWISSTICRVSCTPQRQQLHLCGVHWDRRRNATVTWRAPLKVWFQHCDIPDYVNTWELCSDYPSMSPYMDRMALFSLEAINEDLPAALSALEDFLELPKGGDLDRVLYEERRALAGLLKRLSPSKLRIPRSWRRKLHRPNVTG